MISIPLLLHLRCRLIFLSAATIVISLSSLSAHDNLSVAIAALSKRIESVPTDASLYFQRGELHRLYRKWRLAAADYNRTAQLDPELSLVEVARGQMLLDEACSSHGPAVSLETAALDLEVTLERFDDGLKRFADVYRRVSTDRSRR